MSFEGYVQVLCEDGHLNNHAYDYAGDGDYGADKKCVSEGCEKLQVFWNIVDETNGIDEETHQCPGFMTFEVLEPAQWKKCDLGHLHCVKEERYKIPTQGKDG